VAAKRVLPELFERTKNMDMPKINGIYEFHVKMGNNVRKISGVLTHILKEGEEMLLIVGDRTISFEDVVNMTGPYDGWTGELIQQEKPMGYYSNLPYNRESCRELAERVTELWDTEDLVRFAVHRLTKDYLADKELFDDAAKQEDRFANDE